MTSQLWPCFELKRGLILERNYGGGYIFRARELNNNIRRVVDLYADLSCSFTKSVDASSEGDSSGRASHKRSKPV
ncbi:hypothetical protein K7X08_030985 [Anisodus acutangulus]|uniref:Protein EARLY FLOWERING 4 domain-containing protein n=1 Tax=Anisodus acutangulus TaxID=402998 RepID=A0A9Q1MUU4_9SOLA|nr:hypothetical protein K7X08_030985 [Anisodus acutangulus]